MNDRTTTIAYLVRPVEGAIKSHVLMLMSGLDRSRFEPVLICPQSSPLYREAEQLGYRVIPLDMADDINPGQDARTSVQLRLILRKLRPDILHIHSAKAGVIGRTAVASMRRRPKVILTLHNFVFDERFGRFKRRLAVFTERRLSRFADRVVAVSNALKDELTADLKMDPACIEVIYDGVRFRDVPRREHVGTIVGTMARLAPQKGVEYLIRAIPLVKQRFPDVRFQVIGDGPFRYWLETTANHLGVSDSVEFLGFRRDPLSIVAGWDVYVQPSVSETFGMTLAEAMSIGMPVVASRTGGIPEIVEDEVTGLLVAPESPEELAERICRLLSDRALAEELGRQGCEFVRSTFTTDRMLEETQALYETVLAEPWKRLKLRDIVKKRPSVRLPRLPRRGKRTADAAPPAEEAAPEERSDT